MILERIPALSVRQPWAWLILHGKDVENRSWRSNFTGWFYIHASKSMSEGEHERAIEFVEQFDRALADRIPVREKLQFGGIIGKARMVGCTVGSSSRWYMPPGFAFALADATPVPFVPVRGLQGFFIPRALGESAIPASL
jgi:hypothetical protein